LSRATPEVACLGILVADFFSSPLPRLPEAGELMVVDEIAQYTGGCAANTAVALARLGIRVGVVGKVGQDPLGAFIIDDLAEKGVDASGIRRSRSVGTSKTLIIPTVSEDRRYIHKIGANADFGLEDVSFDYLSQVKLIYIGGYLAMARLSQEGLVAILKYAKGAGIVTVLDIILPGTGDWLAQCREALRYVDAFLPNNDEAEGLTGEGDPSKQAEALLGYGPRMVVITMGGEGSLLMTKQETVRAGCYPMPVVDASGAGDAFAAGFSTGLLRGWSLVATLKFASAMGASCVRKLGCTAGLFTMPEAQAFVGSNTLELTVERRDRHD
jgi:sugar/nucleoside kinase (ribokinase family)